MRARQPPREIVRTLRYPDFLGIGVQKCGTSWLDANLRDHQELWLPPIKELHFFDSLHLPASHRDAGRWRQAFVRESFQWHFENMAAENWDFGHFAQLAQIAARPADDAWYGTIFAAAGPFQLCGEITPDYSLVSEQAIRHAVALSPEIRILINLRDPIARDWSEIRMIAAETGRSSLEDLQKIAGQPDVVHRTDYAGLLVRWLAHVPAERIKVLFLDDIVEKPAAVLRDVCRFLGVADWGGAPVQLTQPVNPGLEREIPPQLYAALKERHRPLYQELRGLFPEMARRWSHLHYR